MNKILYLLLVFILVNFNSFSQEIASNNVVSQVDTTNEYNITTTITGLKNVDIARISYKVSDKHTYKASPKNTFFANRDVDQVKFYIMGIPNDGKIEIHLGIKLNSLTTFLEIPVEFQYSRNEEKKVLKLETITLGQNILASENISSELISDAKENTIIEASNEEYIIAKEDEVKEANNVDKLNLNELTTDVNTKKIDGTTENKNNQTPQIQAEDSKENTVTASRSSITFSVQILALSSFSQTKLNAFCKQHNLLRSEITTKQIDGLMKIRYGIAYSKEDASKLRRSLINKGVNGAFIVKLN